TVYDTTTLFVAKRFSGQDPGGGGRGVERGEERDGKGDRAYDQPIGPARGEGQVVDGVHLGRERETIMAAEPGKTIAGDQAEDGASQTDQQALQKKDRSHLARFYPEGHHDRDIACLFHDHHGQSSEDFQRRDANNQTDDDEGDYLLKSQGAKEGPVLFHPVVCKEAWPGGLLDGMADLVGT